MAARFTPTETVAGVTLLFEVANRKLGVELVAICINCDDASKLVTVRFCVGTLVVVPTGTVNVNVDGVTFRDPNPGNPVLIWIGIVTVPNPLPLVGVSVSVPVVPEATN